MSKHAYILLIPAFLILAFVPLAMSHKNASARAALVADTTRMLEDDQKRFLDLQNNYMMLRLSIDQYLKTGNTNYLTDPKYIQKDLVRLPVQPTTTR